jgi:hypothetical protein
MHIVILTVNQLQKNSRPQNDTTNSKKNQNLKMTMFLELKNLPREESSLFFEVGKRSVQSMRESLPHNHVILVNGMCGTFLHRNNSDLKLWWASLYKVCDIAFINLKQEVTLYMRYSLFRFLDLQYRK